MLDHMFQCGLADQPELQGCSHHTSVRARLEIFGLQRASTRDMIGRHLPVLTGLYAKVTGPRVNELRAMPRRHEHAALEEPLRCWIFMVNMMTTDSVPKQPRRWTRNPLGLGKGQHLLSATVT
eukprot:5389208-Amphidinium_carterae.1